MHTPAFRHLLIAALPLHAALAQAADGAVPARYDEDIVVVAPAPGSSARLAAATLPFAVQSADAAQLARAQAGDLADYLATRLGSVSVNAAQGNPLQPDVMYRGFAASPLLGIAQGIAVYQDGARVNEPLGDTVNWDLLPETAVHGITLLGGSNPLYGLNALGGALSIEMKNGFTFDGHEAQIAGGDWDRREVSIESGGNDGRFGYYVAAEDFREDGWRDASGSRARNLYAALGYRGAASALDLAFQHGDSELTGNGSAPVGLLAQDRAAIFTAPDTGENRLAAFTLDARHTLANAVDVSLGIWQRRYRAHALNGDDTDLQACELGAGRFLLDELDEDALGTLGLDTDAVCDDNVLGAADPDALEDELNALGGPSGTRFDLEDLTPALSGNGTIVDEAVNNRSRRVQRSTGFDLQAGREHALFGLPNRIVVGIGRARGTTRFVSHTELSGLDPVTRSTRGLGVGTFIDAQATDIDTATTTDSIYAFDSLSINARLTLTAGGRFNRTRVELADRSGERPELDGTHRYSRFNPALGASFALREAFSVYAGYSESARAPTPIELACNDRVFERARAAAIARGDDPDDIDFECRLPNAFLADPDLELVVARSLEAGVRGTIGALRHRVGWFRTVSHDDILFQTTGRGTGLFANVDRTRREGIEVALEGSSGALDYAVAYTWLHASFDSDFRVRSPNHPAADADGELAVRRGDRIPGLPRHQFKLSIDYRTPWPLGLGLDLLAQSGQTVRGDEANALPALDGFALLNLRASYAASERMELFARIDNVLDTGYESFGQLGESPAELLPGLADQRPLYLGPGAPRAARLGLTVRL